jgi:hypothetical protein
MFKQGFPNFWIMIAPSSKGRVTKELQDFTLYWYGNGTTGSVANIVDVVFMAIYLAGCSSDLPTALGS